MRKTTLTLLLVANCFLSAVYCQDLHVMNIRGIVINASSGEKLDRVSIRVARQSIATMTNENGRFLIKLPIQNDVQEILFSHIGFRAGKISVHGGDTSILLIKMKPDDDQLKEVVVKSMNPLDLLKAAIAKIPDNYPSTPFRLSGFYRLTGFKEKRIIHLSEAVFDVNGNQPSQGKAQFHLVKSRVDKDLTAFNGADNVEMSLTPEAVMNLDVVGHISESKVLNKQGLKNHQFYFRGTMVYDGQRAYRIDFDERDGVRQSLYKGSILLGIEDLAFLELNTQLSAKGLKYYDWNFGMKINLGLSHIQAKLLSDENHITYQKYGGKYYLNHVKGDARIYLAGGNKHFLLDPLINKTEYLITRIDTSHIDSFQDKEMMAVKKSIEAAHSDTTSHFWSSYNLILPDFNEDSAIRVIQVNNAGLSLKKILQQRLPKYEKDKSVRIDSILSYYYQKEQFKGMALVQYQGKTIFEKGFGMADRTLKMPNTGTTGFRIGSTSKQFTSMLIMQLVSQNKIKVLDSLEKFLPAYPHGNITIQQLLTHQSGIPNYTDNPDYFVKIIQKKYPLSQLVSMFCSDSLEFKPGSNFHYSNSNYVILAHLLETITGKTYAALLREQIFDPLNMKNSYFITSSNHNVSAIGYTGDRPEEPYPIENVTGAGGITSTVEDLLIWSNALNTNKILTNDLTNELFKPRVEYKDWDAYYGYGWMTDRDLFRVSSSHPVKYHPGTEFGFFDMLALQPDNNIVIILLCNMGDFPRFDITDLILTELNR